MPKKYDGPLDRNTDFTHAGPNGEPASGLAVQNYIKSIDTKKYGAGFTLEDGSAHLFFTDETDMNAYIADPTQTELIKDRIELEPMYNITATLISPTVMPVFLGSTGNYIRYTFETVNKNGQQVAESVVATYIITRGTSSRTVTEVYNSGTTVAFNADAYLLEGTNNVSITIKGQFTKVSTTIGVTFQVINLSLTDDFDISKVNDATQAGATIGIPYAAEGSGTKTMEWYVDGERVPYVQAEDEIIETSSQRTKYISIEGLSQGRHSLQFRVGVQVSGENFYSDVLYREFIVSIGASGDAVAVVAATIPYTAGVLGPEDPLIIRITQYESYQLRLAAWKPETVTNTVIVAVDNVNAATVQCISEQEYVAPITTSSYGEKILSLTIGETSRSILLDVAQTSMNISEITTGLELAFQADGRTNESPNRNSWTDGTHTATFSGFNWNDTSGWVDSKLRIQSGASLSFDFAPLASDPSSIGKTVELEFATENVNNDNAVLMNLIGSNGAGIKLTATNIQVKSRGGVDMSRNFKSDENIRVSIVINRKSGATNKGLVFVYINGILSMAQNYANSDSFISDSTLTIGGVDAGILLKQIRIYNTALTSSAVLNNFILYRDSISEMVSIYERNDLYETGTTKFDVNKIAGYLPVMIITGNIPAIENTTDKKLQIVAKVEYTNLQDPTRSFRIENGIITGQGTSSMTYPRKNLRIYTQKSDQTVLYDYEGHVVQDRLYSFKAGAQPVDCWCLKTDFAESSGTHNTGVARFWNDVIKNVQVEVDEQNEYVLRTEAQKVAASIGYQYDVRTTVDGFPIVAFYHLTEEDDLIFLGKFNFNNDKSTESVFGFCDIPGFDDEHVQCFEFLDSGNDLALFKTVENFDSDWDLAWESRYPDTKTPNLVPLKRLATWITSTKNDLQKWIDEKEDYFDVQKLASYYVYLMRFGAVDQTVKNSMITTEDGEHWYFILYDNDTILGVRNDGLLRYGPEIDRQSIDEELSTQSKTIYAYAGHDSTLWNNFEADPECMALAKSIDSALYSAGLTYENVLNMFNVLQAGKWCESIYNQDAQYKYIDPYTNKGLNYLGSLQGSRSDHRKWWLSSRFSLYDALYVNGAYTGNAVIMLLIGAERGTQFTVTSGKDFYYGFGGNNLVYVAGQYIEQGQSHTFALTENMTIGSPLRIYAPYYLSSMDLSNFIEYIGAQNFNFSAAYNSVLGSKLKTLILGVSNHLTDLRRNNALADISSIGDIITLETLNIAGYTAITNANLSTLVNLKTLKAKASGLTSVSFANGAPVTTLELPASMQAISLRSLPYLNASGIDIEDNAQNVYRIDVRDCPNVSDSADFILDWLDNKTSADEDCEVYMDTVNWQNMDVEDLMEIVTFKENGGTLTLYGECHLVSIGREENAERLVAAFGADVFTEGSAFYVEARPAIFLSGPTTVLEGDNAQYSAILVGAESGGTLTYQIQEGGRTGTSINANTGLLTTTENGLATSALTLRVLYIVGTTINSAILDISVAQRKYPAISQVNIDGSSQLVIGTPNTYTISYSTTGITGAMTATWSLSGELATYASIISQDNNECTIALGSTPVEPALSGTISLTLIKTNLGTTIGTTTKSIGYQDDTIAISRAVNPYAMDVMIANNLINSSLGDTNDKMTKVSASTITESQLQPGSSYSTSIFYSNSAFLHNCTSFREFKWFTGISSVPDYLFYSCAIEEIELPPNVSEIGYYAFGYCHIDNIYLHEGITRINEYAFYGTSLRKISFPSTLIYAGSNMLNRTPLTEIDFGNAQCNVYQILGAFDYSTSPASLTFLGGGRCTKYPIYHGGGTRIQNIHIKLRSTDEVDTSLFESGESMYVYIKQANLYNITTEVEDFNVSGCTDGSELGGENLIYHETSGKLLLGASECTVPSAIHKFGRYCLFGSTTTMTFDNAEYEFYTRALYNNSSIVFPQTLTAKVIEDNALGGCSVNEFIFTGTSFGTGLDNSTVTKIYCGSQMTSFASNFSTPNLISLEVDENNVNYTSGNGGNFIGQYSNNRLTIYKAVQASVFPSTHYITIHSGAYKGNLQLTSFIAPQMLTQINGSSGNGPFVGCYNLELIDFRQCLSAFILPGGCLANCGKDLAVHLGMIGIQTSGGDDQNVFYRTNLKTITADQANTYIVDDGGNYIRYNQYVLAFGDNPSFDNSATGFKWDSQYNDALVTLTINGNMSMPSRFLGYCSNLKTLILSNGITSTPQNFGDYLINLETLSIPQSLTTLTWLYGCGLESFVIPDTVTTISLRIVHWDRLKSLKIGSGISELPSYIGMNCALLESIDFSASITSINSWSAYQCPNLVSCTIKATTPPSLTGPCFDLIDENYKIYVPSESVNAYKTASGWSAYASHITAIQE